MPLSQEEVGQRIRLAREEKRWSRLDLAVAMDVSPASIQRWEKGRLPRVLELLRLSRVLEKPDDYLTEPPERQLALADLDVLLRQLSEKVDEALGGIADLLELVAALDARGEDAQGGTH